MSSPPSSDVEFDDSLSSSDEDVAGKDRWDIVDVGFTDSDSDGFDVISHSQTEPDSWSGMEDDDSLPLSPSSSSHPPSRASAWLTRDLDEVALIDSLYSAPPHFSRGTSITLRLGFPVPALRLCNEQLRAWRLFGSNLAVEVSMPGWDYWAGNVKEMRVTVGVCDDLAGGRTALTPCALSWVLEQRIRKESALQPHLPSPPPPIPPVPSHIR